MFGSSFIVSFMMTLVFLVGFSSFLTFVVLAPHARFAALGQEAPVPGKPFGFGWIEICKSQVLKGWVMGVYKGCAIEWLLVMFGVSSLFKFRVCVKVEESMISIIGVHDVSPKSVIVESTGLSFCSPNHVF